MKSCNQKYCPWVQDPQNPRRFVCLKCHQRTNLNHTDLESGIWLLPVILVAIVIAVATMPANSTTVPYPHNTEFGDSRHDQ